jgi:ABC-type lipoprotein release transport system permease subunit
MSARASAGRAGLGFLAWRSACFHWRSHAAVAVGVGIAAAVLCGSLIIGASVSNGLEALARARIGRIDGIITSGDRLYRAALAERLAGALDADAAVHGALVAPVLLLPGVAANPEQGGRTGGVQVIGVDGRFWGFAPARQSPGGPDGVLINRALSAALALKPGDTMVLRVEKPGLLPRDAPQAEGDDDVVALRVTIAGVADDDHFGSFSLQSGQAPPLSAFVPLSVLQAKVAMPGACSLFLLHAAGHQGSLGEAVTRALTATWRPADADIEVRELPGAVIEVRSHRIFLDPALASALPAAAGILSYFVNDLGVSGRHTPYSLVAAGDWARLPGSPPELNALTGDGIVLNQWCADDLQATVGDHLTLRYSVLGAMSALVERSADFTVRGVVPLSGLAGDRELMPAFPGIAEAASCREWKPGMAIDLNRIRDKDEDYWKVHRGTPKAFVSLATGQRLWANRFGSLTALRQDGARATRSQVEDALKAKVTPAEVGLSYIALRERALSASANALDFGSLFLSLGIFLIAAALVLAGLLMSLAIAARRSELGVLLAIGFTPGRVRRLVLLEISLTALIGSALGCLAGVAYARAVLTALDGSWRAAVGGGAFALTVAPATLALGFLATAVTAGLTLWWATRRICRQPARVLLAGAAPDAPLARRGLLAAGIAVAAAVAALLQFLYRPANAAAASESFFMIGSCALVALVAGLAALAGRRFGVRSLPGLALANATRRRGRSLAVVTVLASAVFLIVAVGAFRRDGAQEGAGRATGTGGFALVAEATVPIAGDLNRPETQRKAGLEAATLAGVSVVGLRADDGDDASCLNLNHSAVPRLFAVDPAELARRSAFAFAATLPGLTGSPWAALGGEHDGAIPAIADQATLEWSLGKALGDTVTYQDEQGRPFAVRIIASLDHSLLQGGLIIAEEAFTARFPSLGGCRLLLIDAPAVAAPAVAAALTRAFSDHGLRVEEAHARLDSYLAVERTYLDIFQALGACALLLGSAGVGVVLLQGALERQGELAMMRALGFTRAALARVLLGEHLALFACALFGGAACGLIAVYPQVSGGGLPWLLLGGIGLALAVSGTLWMVVGTWWALHGARITAMRSE